MISLNDESSMLIDNEPNLNLDQKKSKNALAANEAETTAAASVSVSSPQKVGLRKGGVLRSVQSDYLIRQSRKQSSEITEEIKIPRLTAMQIRDETIEEKSKIKQLENRIDDQEVNDRRMASQLQMVLDQQKNLMHSYYQLDTKYKEVARENKYLKNEFTDLKSKLNSIPGSTKFQNKLAAFKSACESSGGAQTTRSNQESDSTP